MERPLCMNEKDILKQKKLIIESTSKCNITNNVCRTL